MPDASCFIISGFNDLHVHAPQLPNRGLGMDRELLPWLNAYTFPEEAKFGDEGYAKRVYGRFVRELWRVGTMRAAVFATIHAPSARVLADLMEAAGLGGYVVGFISPENSSDKAFIFFNKYSLANLLHNFPFHNFSIWSWTYIRGQIQVDFVAKDDRQTYYMAL